MKVDELATKLGYANRQSIYSLESRESIDLLTLKKIAEIFDIPLSTFIDPAIVDNIQHPEEQKSQNSTDQNYVKEIYKKDQKIIELQDRIIKLQEKVIALTEAK